MIIEKIQFQGHQKGGTKREPEDSWIWRTVSTFYRVMTVTFYPLRDHFVLYISTITPPPPSSLLQRSFVFIVPFDPNIPLFTFLSLLGINTHRILTEESLSSPSTRQSQENNLKLMNDPMCGLTAGGEGCALDCDIHPDFSSPYSDPTCLRDCGQYPACFQQLYRDFETAGRVGIIKQSIYPGLLKQN